MKVLIVEDDIDIQTLVSHYFTKEGYEVELASDGEKGLEKLKTAKHNLIVLDIMLPKLDGVTFTKLVKEKAELYGNPYIIMLTAKTEIDDVLAGLKIGADDYIKKPFDPRELILRANRFLMKERKNRIKFLGLEIDEDRYLVTNSGEEIELSKKEFELLVLLIKNRENIITREKVLEEVWGSNYYSGDRTVDVYISKLRDKIPFLTKCIKTVKGVGYRLEEKI